MKVVGFAGYSGAGKTTLVEKLIPVLKRLGQRVSVVKHAHHKFDIDHPGKDTYRHREAGAFEVVVASDKRLAVMREFEAPVELSVHQLLAEVLPVADWVLVEGFRHSDVLKIEIWREPLVGRHHHLEGTGLAMAIGVLAGMVDVEPVVRVLDHRHPLAGLLERRDEALQ